MKYNKVIILKNGMNCRLRNGEEGDGQAVLENYNLTHEQTDFLLSYPDENHLDVIQENCILKEKCESEKEIEIVAVINNSIIGSAGLHAIGRQYKVQHRVEFGISVAKEYWGLGVGRALMDACIECAKLAGYMQLELSVVSDNTRAITMYEKAGFTIYGKNPKGFRSRVSGFQELLYMRLEL